MARAGISAGFSLRGEGAGWKAEGGVRRRMSGRRSARTSGGGAPAIEAQLGLVVVLLVTLLRAEKG